MTPAAWFITALAVIGYLTLAVWLIHDRYAHRRHLTEQQIDGLAEAILRQAAARGQTLGEWLEAEIRKGNR